MRSAAVISNEGQLKAFDAWRRSGRTEYALFCDNPSFYASLESRGIRFERLDEFQLQDRWAEINAWGRGKAADWARLWRGIGGEGPNLGEVDFLMLGYTLVQALKNFLLAETLLERSRPEQLVLFDSRRTRRYPAFSGNSFLNYFLRTQAENKGITIEQISVSGDESRSPLLFDARSPLSRRLVQSVKWALKKFYSLFAAVPSRPDVLVYGALRHLEGLSDELRKKGLRLAVYDFDFHKDQSLFSLKRGLPYLIPQMFGADDSTDAAGEDFVRDLERRFEHALEFSRRERLFSYRQHDLSDFVQTQLFNEMGGYFTELARERRIYARLAERVAPRAILVDEDFAPQRSFFVSFMTSRLVRSFCVSHANFAVDFEIPEASRVFAKSLTIVQSEFEKQMYAVRGWDPATIGVLGTPRYDTLFQKAARKRASAEKRPYRLLCVGSGFAPQTPDTIGYLGSHVYCLGELQRLFLQVFFEAIDGLPVEIVIKPHDCEDEPIWRQLAKGSPAADRVKVVPSSLDFVDLMLDCDALVLSFWSNTMVEAALIGRPVFYLDIPAQRSPTLSVWQRKKYCELFSDAAAFRRELQKRLASGARDIRRHPQAGDSYFLGRFDGNSTARAAHTIASRLVAGGSTAVESNPMIAVEV